ncbi:DUF4115 domain-containing protein [Geminicoccaceae bacterium 1502E]|nr:DUF4115 domain-containing protein [Geminicoccaceae bacterium 1502E]
MDRSQADILEAVGLALRDARQARGESLEQAAAHLRIKHAYLAGLEAGDLAALPGRTYALGFVRSYAVHLGFDGEEVVEAVRQALDPVGRSAALHYQSPESEERRPGGLLIAASILVAGGLYLGWQVSGRDGMLLERVADMPGELGRYASDMLDGPQPGGGPASREASAPAPPAPSVPDTAPQGAPVMLQAGSDEEEKVPPVGSSAALGAREPAPEAVRALPPAVPPGDAASALAAELPRVPHAEDARSAGDLLASLGGTGRPQAGLADGRIVLQASESSWIQVRSRSRDFVRTQTLEPGERLVLPERDDLALWTGNAGGLEIIVEGSNLGTLGASGKVLRDVPLTAEALRDRLAAGR